MLEGREDRKFRIELQNFTFDSCFKVNIMFKTILELSALIPTQFPYKTMTFSIKLTDM